MANPLKQSIAQAGRDSRAMADIFGRLGNTAHPRGGVLTAYRKALRALRGALKPLEEPGGYIFRATTDGILAGLRAEIYVHIDEALQAGANAGYLSAERQLSYYDIPSRAINIGIISVAPAIDAVMGEVDRQIDAARSMLMVGAALTLILGDRTRQGILRPAPVVRDAARWIAAIRARAFTRTVQESSSAGAGRFQKQAIAALDERTTECCLNVHGQIVDLDKPFHLTGTPRYADYIDAPPFHDWCRTAVVLYRSEYDEGLTEEMRAAARKIKEERAAGGTGARHPAHARS